MKAATLALIVTYHDRAPTLVDTLCDDREISVLERAILGGEADPLHLVYDHRNQQSQEENEFADYVEELLSQPFVKPEIQEHGLNWMKSKIRIEQYQQSEVQAAKIISDFAFDVFLQDRGKTDFMLAGPSAEVRVRVFVLKAAAVQNQAA